MIQITVSLHTLTAVKKVPRPHNNQLSGFITPAPNLYIHQNNLPSAPGWLVDLGLFFSSFANAVGRHGCATTCLNRYLFPR